MPKPKSKSSHLEVDKTKENKPEVSPGAEAITDPVIQEDKVDTESEVEAIKLPVHSAGNYGDPLGIKNMDVLVDLELSDMSAKN